MLTGRTPKTQRAQVQPLYTLHSAQARWITQAKGLKLGVGGGGQHHLVLGLLEESGNVSVLIPWTHSPTNEQTPSEHMCMNISYQERPWACAPRPTSCNC